LRILVSGAAGLVGIHVGEVAAACGHEVRLSDLRAPPPFLRRLVPDAPFVLLDVRDAKACAAAAEGCGAIIHCAAVVGQERAGDTPTLAVDVNVKGTANLLEVARATRARLIHVSTASLYGHRPDLAPIRESDPLQPTGMYDSTKQMVEILITAYRNCYGVDGASIRPGYVYGLGAAIGEYFLPRAVRGEPIDEPDGADTPCDVTYVLDLADALVKAANAPGRLPESVYNVSGGVLRLRSEMAEIVRQLVSGARITVGPGINPGMNLRGPNILDLARRDFGYVPRYTLEQGMANWLERLRAAA
jgi:nucleoside-diphosphate-sugar epimerase